MLWGLVGAKIVLCLNKKMRVENKNPEHFYNKYEEKDVQSAVDTASAGTKTSS